MKKTILLLSIIFTLSCSQKQNDIKIVYDNTVEQSGIPEEKETLEESPKSKLISGLPFKLDSAKTRIFPIAEIKLKNKKDRSIKFSSYSGSSFDFFAVGSYSNREYYGYLENLIFEKIDDGEKKLLTNDKIKIKTFGQLYTQNNKPLKKIIYKIITVDSNKDNELDENDLTNLYLSSIDGENLKLISKVNEDLIDWTLLGDHLLYFRTIEDSDKNGELEESDEIHIYKTDLTSLKTSEVLELDLRSLNE